MTTVAGGGWRTIKCGDDYRGAEPAFMRFHLTYEGVLLGASRNQTRAAHKHSIRKVFHNQIERLWDISPRLHRISRDYPPEGEPVDVIDYRRKLGRYDMFGHRFVPLIDEDDGVLCELDILLLRADGPGAVVRSGDLDNRIKTLMDALRLPHNRDEAGGQEGGDHPFFCLLRDDALVERLTVRADALLQPVSVPANTNDARVTIEVNLRPYKTTLGSMQFL